MKGSFVGRGRGEPKCFITEAEIAALGGTFPKIILFVCIFFFLKAVY